MALNSNRAPYDRSLGLLGILLSLSTAAFLIGLGEAPIERAEIYFLDAARAMVERSDFVVPYYRGEPFYDKPPLTYWLLASSFKFFGPSLFAGRLVAAFLALLTMAATFLITRQLGGGLHSRSTSEAESTAAAGFFATAILGTSYAFVSFARLTMSDMLLTLLTLLAGGAYLRSEMRAERKWLILCGSILGLGFLTKGPIAWIYFGALLVAHSVGERRRPRIFDRSGLLSAFCALVLGLSWFFFVYLREGLEPLKWFFLRENLQRFAAPTYDTDQPFWYYFMVYALEGLPWSVLLIPSALFGFGREGPRILRTLLTWSALMLSPLSLSRGKIDYYLLPLLPPLSMAMGLYLASGRPGKAILRVLALVTAGLLVGAGLLPMLPAPFAPAARMVGWIHNYLMVAAAACALSAIWPKARNIVFVCAASVLGTAILLFGSIVPAYRSAQPTAALLDHIARERIYTPDLEIAVCDDTLRLQRDILFTLRIPVLEHCELWQVVSSSRKFLIIVTLPQERSLRTADNVRHIVSLAHLPAEVTRWGTLLDKPSLQQVGLLANFQTRDPEARYKRNREFKRWLDTPEGQKAEAERLARERIRDAELRRAGLK